MKREIIIGPIVLLIIWGIIHYTGLINQVLLPSPIAVAKAVIAEFSHGKLLQDLVATIIRFLWGFLSAAIVGIILGVILGYYEKLYSSVEVIIDFFRSVPATALFPLFMLFFGVGDFAKISVVFFSCSLIILINTAYGVKNASLLRIRLARVLRANRNQLLFKIILPDSLPHIFAGLRIGISFALLVVVVTEMFLGTLIGLGHRIIDDQLIYKVPEMYAAIIVTGILGYILNKGFVYFEHRIVHWSGK